MALSIAASVLAEKVKPRGATRKIAERLGVTPSLITRWKRGDQKPMTTMRLKMQRALRIPLSDWEIPMEPS